MYDSEYTTAQVSAPATTERLTFFSFLRFLMEYITPLFSSLHYLLVRNINTVAMLSSSSISLLTTFKGGKKSVQIKAAAKR